MARARKHFPPIRWRSASDDSRSGQKNEKRLIYGTGFSARHDSPTSICFFFCGVSFTAPALPGQSPPSVTFFLFFLFGGLQLNQPRVSREIIAQSHGASLSWACAFFRCLQTFFFPSALYSFFLLFASFFFNHYLEYRCASHPP